MNANGLLWNAVLDKNSVDDTRSRHRDPRSPHTHTAILDHDTAILDPHIPTPRYSIPTQRFSIPTGDPRSPHRDPRSLLGQSRSSMLIDRNSIPDPLSPYWDLRCCATILHAIYKPRYYYLIAVFFRPRIVL